MKKGLLFSLLSVCCLAACSQGADAIASITATTLPTAIPTVAATDVPATTSPTAQQSEVSLSDETLMSLLSTRASGHFPLSKNARLGTYDLGCIIESLDYLDENEYFQVGDYDITAIANCSYLDANDQKRTAEVAVSIRNQEERNTWTAGYFPLGYLSNPQTTKDDLEQRGVIPGSFLLIGMGIPNQETQGLNTEGYNDSVILDLFSEEEFVEFAFTGQAPEKPIVPLFVEVRDTGHLQTTPAPEEEGLDKPHFDLSAATLEHSIDPNCVDQFPQTLEAKQSNVVCFTLDEWIIADTPGQYPLAGGYEMLAGIEGWVEQDGQNVPVIIPLVTANQEEGKMQVNGALIQDLEDHLYTANEIFWSKVVGVDLGDTLWIVLDMPNSDLANNSTQGFGFDATPYTESELDELLTTGNFDIFGNALWPVIDIDGRD